MVTRHTLYGCVDWNQLFSSMLPSPYCHTLYGCVDWNFLAERTETGSLCHTLYGCVDWNSLIQVAIFSRWVTPCMGVWIETFCIRCLRLRLRRHTLYGCVDWNKQEGYGGWGLVSHTLYGCVDWNTFRYRHLSWMRMSHPVWVCGLKQLANDVDFASQMSHPVWVCGLKHTRHKEAVHRFCHTLYGCVDWNFLGIIKTSRRNVTPCMGVWIETF